MNRTHPDSVRITTSGAADLPEALIHAGMQALLQCTASELENLSPTLFEGYAGDVQRVFVAMIGKALSAALSAGQATAAQQPDSENLRKALQFYADSEHFIKADGDAWDTVSGEPQNYWCDEAGTATVEDGHLARLALSGHPVRFEDDAAQPAAQQGVAYAALPTSNYAGRVYEEGFLIGTCPLYTADQMHAFADATHTLRASHGQAPATQPAHQQEAQEPVAVVVPCYTPSGKRVALYSAKQDLPIGTQLYTAPQPAERAPLTANQVSGLAESAGYWHGDMSRADFINGIRCAEVAHGIKGENHDR